MYIDKVGQALRTGEGYMEKWYVGVDGGGTKTEFAVSASDGIPVATLRKQGCSYQSIGVEKATALVITGVTEILSMVNADKRGLRRALRRYAV